MEHSHEAHAHEDAVHSLPPHEPAPPEPRRLLPEPETLVRGAGLAALAVAAGWAAIASWRVSWFLAPASAAFGAASLLAAWAAAIHLTGGEKFDDHPFV